MQYVVQTVGENELPQGVNRMIVEREHGPAILLINGEPARCWAYMQTWQDMQEPCTEPTLLLPQAPPLLHAV